MDDIVFSEDGIIPYLTLFHHLKKLYPYIDDNKLKLFVSLVDTNNDKRIEIQEMFVFLNEIYMNEINYQAVMLKISSIIYSTNETIETFFQAH
jgi:hypothetical protein